MDDQLKQIIDRAVADGVSDEDIDLLVQEHTTRNGARTQAEEHPFQYLGETAGNILPSAGRAVKDLATGLGSLPGIVMSPSKLMNAASNFIPGVIDSAKQRYGSPEARARTVRDDPVGMVSDMAGLVSGAGAVKNLAATATKGAGKLAYKGGVALGNPTIKREFGLKDMAARGFEEGISLNAKGADKAAEAGKASADAADALIAQRGAQTTSLRGPSNPGQTPGFLSIRDAAADVRPLYDKAGTTARGVNEPARQQIVELTKDMGSGHQWPMSLPEGQAMKRAEQEIAHQTYRTLDRGGHVPATEQTRAQFGKAVASGTQRALEREVPEVAAINSRTQDLMGLERLSARASEANHILPRLLAAGPVAMASYQGAGAPAAIASAILTAALTSPGGLSQGGLILKRIAEAINSVPGVDDAAMRRILIGQSGAVQAGRQER